MLAERTARRIEYRHSFRRSFSNLTFNRSTSPTQTFSKPSLNTHDGKKSQNTSKFLVFWNSQITKNGRNGSIKEAEAIFDRIPCRNIITWTAMLTAYAENGKIVKARKVFDEMPERNIASYNAMITAYIRTNVMMDEASELFANMPEHNSVSYAALITGFVRAGMLDKAVKLYSEMPVMWRGSVCSNALISGYLKMGRLEEAVGIFEGMMEKDVVTWSSVVDGYCKKGRISDARMLFDKMPERNVVTWTSMINGYMKMGCFEDGFEMFLDMRREGIVDINSTTLAIMFAACGSFGRYREGTQMYKLVLCMGFEFDVFLGNSLITMYYRFGCIDEASKIFYLMSKKDVVSWNSIIAGYVQNDKIEEAYRFFMEMPKKDVISWTTMITGFFSKGMIEKSIQLFEMMPEKDDVVWTAVITGFADNGEYENAICWFIQMRQKSVRPNPLTLSSVLGASACLATLNQGLQIHAHVLKTNMEFDLSVQNSLISMYSKCGNVSDAYQIFTEISAPNIVSFNSMITGFAQNGFGEEALQLFKNMQHRSQEPNEITFLGVLSSCTHVGMVEEGWNHFKSMRVSYKIEPGPDHFACMVDLLGRAGLVEEAIDLIHSMPFEPHAGVWGALLAASRTHFRIDLAKLAAQHLSELEPQNATPYVVLSNLYSMAGKKKDGELVRRSKKSKSIKKNPGCSWVIVKDKVHLFLAGDQSHVDFEEIKFTLLTIVKEMGQLDCGR